MDNAGFHRAKDVDAYLKKRKVSPVFIVPKVPQLNAIELFFKILKKIYKEPKFTKMIERRNLDLEVMIKNAAKRVKTESITRVVAHNSKIWSVKNLADVLTRKIVNVKHDNEI